MKTATVRLFGQTKNVCENQAGVALLQVLILSALLSLVAVRFTITARDQLAMAGDLEHRLQAQMVAHSTFNQIIFSQLSQNIDVVSSDTKKTALTLPSSSILNRFGEPVKWADGVVIKMQDTNGLLPLMFPRHILWRALLKARSVPQEKVDEYLGILTDVQDADVNSWNLVGREPQRFSNGAFYLNGYAQNNKIVEWVFSDNAQLAGEIGAFSDVDGSYDTNLLNSPAQLLSELMSSEVADAIVSARRASGVQKNKLVELIPAAYIAENMYVHDSSTIIVDVEVTSIAGGWTQRKVIDLNASASPVFNVLRNQ